LCDLAGCPNDSSRWFHLRWTNSTERQLGLQCYVHPNPGSGYKHLHMAITVQTDHTLYDSCKHFCCYWRKVRLTDCYSQFALRKQLWLTSYSSSGNASLRAPSGGWNSTELQAIFSQTLPVPNSKANSPNPSPTQSAPQPSPTPNNPRSKYSSPGFIAGLTTSLAVSAAIIGFIIRHHTKQAKKRQGAIQKASPDSSQPDWLKSELSADSTRTEIYGDPVEEIELDGRSVHAHELESAFVGYEADANKPGQQLLTKVSTREAK